MPSPPSRPTWLKPTWRWQSIARWLDQHPQTFGVVADHRHAPDCPHAIFVALEGKTHHGLTFADQAIAHGCTAVLIHHPRHTTLPVHPPLNTINWTTRRIWPAVAPLVRRWHDHAPAVRVAVTGTNGKTSVCDLLRQIWSAAGFCAASIGTLGVRADSVTLDRAQRHFRSLRSSSLTTPDAISFVRIVDALARAGVTHLAFEASSIALVQHRLRFVAPTHCVMLPVTRDHLDDHGSLRAYVQAKLRLLRIFAPARSPVFATQETCQQLNLPPLCHKHELHLQHPEPQDHVNSGSPWWTVAPFLGANVAMARRVARATGVPDAISATVTPDPTPGRLEKVGSVGTTDILIDYAHTPDAITQVLTALTRNNRRTWVVMGCGGDRDIGKRPLMGLAASTRAERIIITDDNPRSEDPGLIRNMVASTVDPQKRVVIDNRRTAILHAVKSLATHQGPPPHTLVIAGRGSEPFQQTRQGSHAFCDAAVARLAIDQHGDPSSIQPLWTHDEIRGAFGSRVVHVHHPISFRATSVAIDSRTLRPSGLFIALAGQRTHGGHSLRDVAGRGGAAALITRSAWQSIDPDTTGLDLPIVVIDLDERALLWQWAHLARKRFRGTLLAVTGSVGKTSVTTFIRALLSVQDTVEAGHNNAIGVPLSLLRLPPDAPFAVCELGSNHAGEICELAQLACPHIGIISAIDAAHAGTIAPQANTIDDAIEQIAQEKAGIVEGIVDRGVLIAPAHHPSLNRALAQHPDFNTLRIKQLAWKHDDPGADAVLSITPRGYRLSGSGSASWRGSSPHRAWNTALAILACQAARQTPSPGQQPPSSPPISSQQLENLPTLAGRDRRHHLPMGRIPLILLDGSYNAAPASVRSLLLALTRHNGPRWVVLSDLAELGRLAKPLHESLIEPLAASHCQRIFLLGSMWASLRDPIAKRCHSSQWSIFHHIAPLTQSLLEALDEYQTKTTTATSTTRDLPIPSPGPPPELILGIKGSRAAGLDAIAQNVIAYAQQPSTNRDPSC